MAERSTSGGWLPLVPRVLEIGSALILAVALVQVHAVLAPYAEDDAYIHLRIARNYLATGEPFYNHGEPVMVSSSPIWILLIAGLWRLVGVSLAAVAWVNLGCTVGVSLIGAWLTRKCAPSTPALLSVPTMWLLSGVLLPASCGLMESPLALLLLLAGSSAHFSEVRSKTRTKGILSGVLCGLAAGTRIEFLPVVLLLFGIRAFQTKSATWDTWSGFTLLVVGWGAWCYFWFGTVIPHAAVAKSIAYSISSTEALTNIAIRYWGERLFVRAPLAVLSHGVVLLAFIPILFGAVWRVVALRYLLVPSVVLLLGYTARGVLIECWYVPLYTVPIVILVIGALGTASTCLSRTVVFVALAPLLLSSFLEFSSLSGSAEKSALYERGVRTRLLFGIGHGLSQHHPHARVMAPEIGALGFTFEGQILDGMGLASPAALRFHPLRVPEERSSGASGALPSRYVDLERPDFVVGLEGFLDDFSRSAVATKYRRKDFPLSYLEPSGTETHVELWRSKAVLVFEREENT